MIKKAMIMAAGVGSRLDPLTQNTPKPLIPMANIPVMELILRHLKEYGIKKVIANTHYLGEEIHKKFKKNDIGIKFDYVHEPELSGTAGGVKKCEFFFHPGETFLVVSGDALTNVNIEKLYERHKRNGALATIALKQLPDSQLKNFGVVVMDNHSKIIQFQEKPNIKEAKSNFVNTGIYMFETEIFNYIPANSFYDFAKNVFPSLMADNKGLYGSIIEESWSDIGTIQQYKTSTMDLLKQKVKIPLLLPKTNFGWAAEDANISNETIIDGTILVGNKSIIEKKVVLSGYNSIGSNCIIKEGAKITNSIIWDNVTIEENAVLDNCIIANDCIIGKSAIINSDVVIAANSKISSNEIINSLII